MVAAVLIGGSTFALSAHGTTKPPRGWGGFLVYSNPPLPNERRAAGNIFGSQLM